MVDVSSSPLFEEPSFKGDGVVELPNLVEGRLADLLAAASAPASPRELQGLDNARSLFDSVSKEWPKSRRLRRSTRVAVVGVSVISLFGATTALAAASALPPPATRAIDGALQHLDINVGPSAPTVSNANPHPSVTGSPAVVATHGPRRHSQPVTVARTTPLPSKASSGKASSGKASSGKAGSGSASSVENYRKLAREAAAESRGNNQVPKPQAPGPTRKRNPGRDTAATGAGIRPPVREREPGRDTAATGAGTRPRAQVREREPGRDTAATGAGIRPPVREREPVRVPALEQELVRGREPAPGQGTAATAVGTRPPVLAEARREPVPARERPRGGIAARALTYRPRATGR